MIKIFIEQTAWPMTPPAPWSAFHLAFLLIGPVLALWLARRFSGVSLKFPKAFPGFPDSRLSILWICGLFLAFGELYKQLFLYEIVNQGQYDWWYFPFQLCSTPMYVCLAFPFLPTERIRRTAAVYLQSFGLLGGIMALLEPSGLMHPYWTLTLHGLIWHVLLIFLACYCSACGLAAGKTYDFAGALFLFFLFCLIATAINIFTGGRADMFYISPYYPVTQVIFHEISVLWGTGPGIAVYLGAVCIGAFLCRNLLNFLYKSSAAD